jgi:hypothetical protein
MGKRKKNKQRFTKHYTNINKANNHLLPQSIEHAQKKHHAILVWHRHQTVA